MEDYKDLLANSFTELKAAELPESSSYIPRNAEEDFNEMKTEYTNVEYSANDFESEFSKMVHSILEPSILKDPFSDLERIVKLFSLIYISSPYGCKKTGIL